MHLNSNIIMLALSLALMPLHNDIYTSVQVWSCLYVVMWCCVVLLNAPTHQTRLISIHLSSHRLNDIAIERSQMKSKWIKIIISKRQQQNIREMWNEVEEFPVVATHRVQHRHTHFRFSFISTLHHNLDG